MNTDTELLSLIRHFAVPFSTEPANVPAHLQPIPGIRAVLFDVYGTLVSSASGDIGASRQDRFADAIQQTLDHLGRPVMSSVATEMADRYVEAIRHQHALMKARGFPFPDVEIREIWTETLAHLSKNGLTLSAGEIERLAIEFECRTNTVWPMEGAREVLNHLKRSGMALGIVSNAQFYTPIMLEALFNQSLSEWGFDPSLCAWSYQQRVAKPAPALFAAPLEALRERGITSAQTLYIGNDMLNDITPSARLGCRTVLFAGDRRSLRLRADHPDVAGVTPDAVITDWNQLHEVLPIAPRQEVT